MAPFPRITFNLYKHLFDDNEGGLVERFDLAVRSTTTMLGICANGGRGMLLKPSDFRGRIDLIPVLSWSRKGAARTGPKESPAFCPFAYPYGRVTGSDVQKDFSNRYRQR